MAAHGDDANADSRERDLYPVIWGTLLSAVDETLREHQGTVLTIADELERCSMVEQAWLAQAVSAVPTRHAEPPMRGDESGIQAGDPLV